MEVAAVVRVAMAAVEVVADRVVAKVVAVALFVAADTHSVDLDLMAVSLISCE